MSITFDKIGRTEGNHHKESNILSLLSLSQTTIASNDKLSSFSTNINGESYDTILLNDNNTKKEKIAKQALFSNPTIYKVKIYVDCKNMNKVATLFSNPEIEEVEVHMGTDKSNEYDSNEVVRDDDKTTPISTNNLTANDTCENKNSDDDDENYNNITNVNAYNDLEENIFDNIIVEDDSSNANNNNGDNIVAEDDTSDINNNYSEDNIVSEDDISDANNNNRDHNRVVEVNATESNNTENDCIWEEWDPDDNNEKEIMVETTTTTTNPHSLTSSTTTPLPKQKTIITTTEEEYDTLDKEMKLAMEELQNKCRCLSDEMNKQIVAFKEQLTELAKQFQINAAATTTTTTTTTTTKSFPDNITTTLENLSEKIKKMEKKQNEIITPEID
ncbi:hypothetical protein PIROE2DRAFT_12070 [Piromyces sp. E2]|nr:hypothetical protein PIROE2DRAFT_12070 [Piromyces sp. E2]|eukprot:OUM61818.1 hypothetical protein PIROE2DRAFT_12070 [Piromyces sp. E2]